MTPRFTSTTASLCTHLCHVLLCHHCICVHFRRALESQAKLCLHRLAQCAHSPQLITRFHVQTDGLTPYQRLKGKPYSGELAEFGEQVYVKDPISRHAKLDDRWIGPVTWIGRADRGDRHMTVSTDGRAVELCRSIRRIPLSQRWKAEAMTRIKVTPWRPKITEAAEIKPTRRYITWDNAATVRIFAKLSELCGRWWSSLAKLSSPVRGTRKMRKNCALWQVSWGAPLEKLVRLRPMPALQHAHLHCENPRQRQRQLHK